jgi:hypothetical protein
MQVKDTGIGIPESFRPYLFESFTQATESCTRTHGGLGLGLAICFNLVRLMHADLSIEARDGGGSTATLSLCMPIALDSIAVSTTDSEMTSLKERAPGGDGAEPAPHSPTFFSSSASRSSTSSRASSAVEEPAGVSDKHTDDSSALATQSTSCVPIRSPRPHSQPPSDGVSLAGTETSLPQLLADSRIKALQLHTAVIHIDSTAASRQLRTACSALGMTVLDMPTMNSPQNFEESLRDATDRGQIRGTLILMCSTTDAAQALCSGWKKRPVIALCVDGWLPHALRVHVTPLATPVKLRALMSAVLLALHGGPGSVSLLQVPLGAPKAVSNSAGAACTAGFGGTHCGFCTRCQQVTDAAALVRCCPASLQIHHQLHPHYTYVHACYNVMFTLLF